MQDLSNLVVYNDGELELKVSVDSETIWLTQLQMSQLFDTSTDNVGLHLKNIYLEKELDENSTTEFFSVVRKEGNRLVKRELKHYNLDVIICVGYRVSSLRATKFRQWATSVLKNYIQNGYAINNHKITEQRLFALENDMQFIKSKIKNNSLEFNQNIFFDGQIYDSYSFLNDLIKLAKSEIVLIDNYIDDTVFTLFSKYPNINFTIYTSTISKQLKLDFEKYSKQYKNISLKTFKSSHDRFLIIDKKDIYHLGASLKDLGKKWFAFSKMSLNSLNLDDILHKLEV
ncbi:virulence RhuM family protein [Aliarcobacter cryaerophilus]|uniref:RhuM family protein n=1 Tax=Aliarcobacter cryaerophilus TaxID=28198 RepID=UPI0021B583ED|nr:RhuM family protein [Aliarcobacter cryaerophilus]MCT7508770.1 virulence RhuM family protein [Aliarcobacter cryaerophilus]